MNVLLTEREAVKPITAAPSDGNAEYWHQMAILQGKRLASILGADAYHEHLDKHLTDGYSWQDLYQFCLTKYEEIKECQRSTIGS